MTSPDRRDSLENHLRSLVQFSNPRAQLLLDSGEWFEWTPRPEGIERGVAKGCYSNATGMVKLTGFHEDTGLSYYEGYVLTPGVPFPIEHAWNVTPDGRVVDTTLRQPGDDVCGFCEGNGLRKQCATGERESSPYGEYGEVDRDCDECWGDGCEEVTCIFCKGTGVDDTPEPEREGTVYVGVKIEPDRLRALLLRTGTYGCLYKPEFYEGVPA